MPESRLPQAVIRPDPPPGYVIVEALGVTECADVALTADEEVTRSQSRPDRTVFRAVLIAAGVVGMAMVAIGLGNVADGKNLCTGTSCARANNPLSLVSEFLQPGALAAETTPDLRSSYFAPAVVLDRSRPARLVLSGPDAPDPFVLVDPPHEYLYTSNGTLVHVNVPTYTLQAGGRWGDLRDALPRLPPWALPGFTWAPDIRRVAGGWALYFTAAVRGAKPAMECIGDAFGSSPLGPFQASSKLFICQVSQRGSIDPRTFVDADGRLWLYWKSDDNANPQIPWTTGNGYTGIWVQRLSPNGRDLLGRPKLVMQPTLPWEGTIIEAPDMIFEQGHYWMFYSGGWFNSPGYAIGAARCSGPAGPCIPTSKAPLIASNSQGAGPGEPSVFENAAGFWILYNPWKSNDPLPTPNRPVVIAHLGFTAVGPYIAQF
jgi:hypothetical protein